MVFPKALERFGGMVVQEYIPQTGTQYKCEVFLDEGGKPKSAVVFDKTRWYPVDGGSTCCSCSVHRPDIAENSVKLLQAIGWRGYGDVDLIEDPRDGVAKVMEINPRITASVKVCFAAGVDFAAVGWANDLPEIEAFMRRNCRLYCKTVEELAAFLR